VCRSSKHIFFLAAIDSTNWSKQGRWYVPLSSLYYLDVYAYSLSLNKLSYAGLLKGKVQYSWPPCIHLFRGAPTHSETIYFILMRRLTVLRLCPQLGFPDQSQVKKGWFPCSDNDSSFQPHAAAWQLQPPGGLAGQVTLKRCLLAEAQGYKTFHSCNVTARLKNVNNCLNTNIYSYLVTPGG
jgi:hypothetical protein